MADNIDRDWNEMCNNLKDVIQIQVNFVHSISEKLQNLEIGTGGSGGGVGEWIEPGTQYTYQGTTYTVGTNVERFNLYGDDGDVTNQAAGSYSHVEGYSNKALGGHSHVEGDGNTATTLCGHVEGGFNTLTGNSDYTHIEGNENTISANAPYAHIEGFKNKIENAGYANYAHIEGVLNIIHNGGTLSGIHIEGSNNEAYANAQYAHIEGIGNIAMGSYDHIEGNNNKTHGTDGYHHIEGYNNDTYSTMGTHIEGNGHDVYSSSDSHIEGEQNEVHDSAEAHVEGMSNKSFGGTRVHIEGYQNTIGTAGNLLSQYSNQAHIEGFNNKIIKRSDEAHCEGLDNSIENSPYSHCEGTDCSIVNASAAHAQNYHTQALGSYASATGDHTIASGIGSFTMGYGTNASGKYQLTLGSFNVSNDTSVYKHDPVNDVDYAITKFPFIIGNGHDDFYEAEYRSDAFKVDCDGKIYVGDANGVDVSGLNVTSADNNKVLTASYSGGIGTYSWQDAPGGGGCVVHTYTDTSLPAKVVLDNNNEYRYLSLSNANSLTISIETIDTTKSFYSTIVLHNVSSTTSLSDFVTVSGDSVISNIIFLNENNVDLSTSDTAELLFFTNGMSNTVMCIAYAYGTPVPPTPPTPSYDETKILVIELDANHDDTTNITEHTTLLSAKNQLDTNYSTDPSKMYKLFIGDDAFNPPIGIEPNTSTFENCLNLYNADIGESINHFYGGAFQGCNNLTVMSIPYAMTHMVGYNIQGTNLPELIIHSNYLEMSGMVDYIFYNNNLTHLIIDATGIVNLAIDEYGVDNDYSDLFAYSMYLAGEHNKPITITFGDNVTGIVCNSSGYMFGTNSGGVTINIPSSVISIGSSFLMGTNNLGGNIVVNIDNHSGVIPGAPWGAGNNCTIIYLQDN